MGVLYRALAPCKLVSFSVHVSSSPSWLDSKSVTDIGMHESNQLAPPLYPYQAQVS